MVQRVAILSPTGWYLPLKRRLESTGELQLLPALAFLPLEEHRIAAEWYPDDAVLLLGTNLDDWRTIALPQSRNHQRTKELLDRALRPRAITMRQSQSTAAFLPSQRINWWCLRSLARGGLTSGRTSRASCARRFVTDSSIEFPFPHVRQTRQPAGHPQPEIAT
ncbi:MAG: hypothetical protein ACT4P6_14090 [Gemmatimonadaceae bacterium]